VTANEHKNAHNMKNIVIYFIFKAFLAASSVITEVKGKAITVTGRGGP
jgi:hypothetical protein